MDRPRQLARVAGVLYLVVAVGGGFAHLYVRAMVYVPGDPQATLAKVAGNAGLVRAGVVADLVQATCFVVLGLVLHSLLAPTGRALARAMVVFVAIAAGMICLNMVHQHVGLLVPTGPAYAGDGTFTLLLFDLQHYGYLTAQIFFGLWLAPLGLLAYRSGLFPRALGVVLVVGCAGYLVDTFVQFLVAAPPEVLSTVLVVPAAVAEFWMLGYLLTVGVRKQRDQGPAGSGLTAPAAAPTAG